MEIKIMKKTYINPSTKVYNVEVQKNMLVTLSGGDTGLRSAGTTSDDGFKGVDVKEDSGWDLFD